VASSYHQDIINITRYTKYMLYNKYMEVNNVTLLAMWNVYKPEAKQGVVTDSLAQPRASGAGCSRLGGQTQEREQ